MSALYDKNRRPIEVGDILKVYHFTGARRKRHYMYKQVMDRSTVGRQKPVPVFNVSHLSLKHDGYCEFIDNRILDNTEIVQSVDANFENRTKKTTDI